MAESERLKGRTVDGGRVVVDEVIESGAATALFRGHLAFDPRHDHSESAPQLWP